MIDFRSDTITRPTPEMLDIMLHAKVGDDVFQDDPSVNRLEMKCAALFGKEAALFCPSGTMTNQIAIKVHTSPGDEVVCDKLAHIYNYEGGGIAFNSGCSVRLLDGDRGRFTVDMLRAAINPDDPHFPVTTLVSIENTCNKGGGVIWKSEDVQSVSAYCREQNLKIHLDGARLFNALVETGETPASVGEKFDSISICMSKGLGCPVGSVLIGNSDFIRQARRVRKVLGGGMRQAGYLAAVAIHALDHHVERLKEDHQRARELAKIINKQSWVKNVLPVETNIVVAALEVDVNQQDIINKLKSKGVLVVGFGPGKIRLVTHLDITDAHIQRLASLLSSLL